MMMMMMMMMMMIMIMIMIMIEDEDEEEEEGGGRRIMIVMRPYSRIYWMALVVVPGVTIPLGWWCRVCSPHSLQPTA
jgi:hypothetical protein